MKMCNFDLYDTYIDEVNSQWNKGKYCEYFDICSTIRFTIIDPYPKQTASYAKSQIFWKVSEDLTLLRFLVISLYSVYTVAVPWE
jgi:hypothetical protein